MKVISLFIILSCKSTFALIGEEIPLLVEIVSKTTSQLNELERIVSNGEKLTRTMVKYNEVLEDHYFRAERLKILSEEIIAKREVEDLSDLNTHLRGLKSAMSDTKKILDSYKRLAIEEIRQEKVSQKVLEITHKKKKLLEYQFNKASKSASNASSNRLTSQNTGLLLESNLNQEVELSKINHQLAVGNRLLMENILQNNLNEQSRESFYQGIHGNGGKSVRELSSNRK